MTEQNNKAKSKFKKLIDKIRRKEKHIYTDEEKEPNFNLLLVITFIAGVVLITASYAWFYASLDVKIDFFKMTVSNNSGLFISLDGKDFSSSVEVSRDSLITDLRDRYEDHTNQWASAGLFATSSNGIRTPNDNKFSMYAGSGIGKSNKDMEQAIEDEVDICLDDCDNQCEDQAADEAGQIACFNTCVKKCEDIRNYYGSKVLLDSRLVNETDANGSNIYIAFDFFLKNVSGSPKSDNLYFDKGTSIYYSDETHDSEDGIINSLRIGLVKVGSVPLKSNINTIQNISCNNKCEMIIYEPNSTLHSNGSIKRATKHNITLIDGQYAPTYALINEGRNLELANGHSGTGIALDNEHFALQNTMSDADFAKPIFEIPNAITKMRAYVWIEGQDVDSLETRSTGGAMSIVINLIKDLAGYNGY